MASHTDLLPPELKAGWVYNRVLKSVGDTVNDEDQFPDGVPAEGEVVFEPDVSTVQVNTDGVGTTVIKDRITCKIHQGVNQQGDPDRTKAGLLIDPAGSVGGVYLSEGGWTATYQLLGASVPPVQFVLTEEHTKDNPLDIAMVAGLTPSPTVKFVVNEQVYYDTLAARDEVRDAISSVQSDQDEIRDLLEYVQVNHFNDVYVGSGTPPASVSLWIDTTDGGKRVKALVGGQWVEPTAEVMRPLVADTIAGGIGGRNLVLDSKPEITTDAYRVLLGRLSEPWVDGATYTATIKGSVNTPNRFVLFRDHGYIGAATLAEYDAERGVYTATFVCPAGVEGKDPYMFSVYNRPEGPETSATIEWIKIERGSVATDWTPAPEDAVDADTLGGLSQEAFRKTADAVDAETLGGQSSSRFMRYLPGGGPNDPPADGFDANTVDRWRASIIPVYNGVNVPSQGVAVLETIPYSPNWCAQYCHKIHATGGSLYHRTFHSGTTWTEWERLSPSRLENISNGTDLNDVTVPGSYALSGASTYANNPTPGRYAFLEVTANTSGGTVRQVASNVNRTRYERWLVGSSWGDWKQVQQIIE